MKRKAKTCCTMLYFVHLRCSSIPPSQTAKFVLGGDLWQEGEGKKETLDYLVQKLEGVLAGLPASSLEPPEIDLVCSHAVQVKRQAYSM